MTPPRRDQRVIKASSVHRVDEPVLLDCDSAMADGRPTSIAVVPIVEGDRVVGLDIRCKCGGNVIVECVYEEET